jgi:DNA-binding transcriptional regulator YhcF (GntR family)
MQFADHSEVELERLKQERAMREEQVAESFAISRNTVREVFRLLGHERLVDHVANRGVHVRRMTSQDISAMYRTRRLVEPLGLRAAIADAEVRAAMRAAVDRATAATEQNDWEKVGTEDNQVPPGARCCAVSPSRRCSSGCSAGWLAFAVADPSGSPDPPGQNAASSGWSSRRQGCA